MAEDNEQADKIKPKVYKNDLNDEAPIGNTESVEVNGDSVEVNSASVVTGAGELHSSEAQINGWADVKNSKNTNIEAETGRYKVKTHPADVSTSSSSEELNIDNPDISELDNNLKANLSINAEVTAKLSDAADANQDQIVHSQDSATHFSLNDSAATQDSIGFSPYVRALAKLLCHKDTSVPLVVGVFGEWGSGKTSFMRQLKSEISEQELKKSKQVWFNAWKYDNQNDLWAALLQAITSQVEENTNMFNMIFRRFMRLVNLKFFINITFIFVLSGYLIWLFYDASLLPKYSEIADTIQMNTVTSIVLHFAMVVFPPGFAVLVFYWLGVLKPIIELVRKMKNPLGLDVNELIHGKSLPDKIEGIRTFEKDLEVRLEDYLGSDGRLIVYVDDLDRCSPEHAVEIIEAVNLFLETDRCIFVLGMDHKLISSSIELKYKELSEKYKELHKEDLSLLNADDRSYGEFFLKKIIQVPIAVPSLSDDELNRYVGSFIHQKEKCISHTKRDNTVAQDANKNDATATNISLSNSTKEVILTLLPYLEPNPRTIKRFYNMLSFIHFFHIANRDNLSDLNDIALTIWFFLLYRFPDEVKQLNVYDGSVTWGYLMAGCDGDCKRIHEFIIDYCKNKDHVGIVDKLDGKIKNYSQVTRILAL